MGAALAQGHLAPGLGAQGDALSPAASLEADDEESSPSDTVAAPRRKGEKRGISGICRGVFGGGRSSLQDCPPGEASLPNGPAPPPVRM